MKSVNDIYGPRLEKLPEPPTPEQFKLEGQWVHGLIETCTVIFFALSEEGIVKKTLKPVLSAIEADEFVPSDIRRSALDFDREWRVMFGNLRPKAVGWLTRQDEVAEMDVEVGRMAAEKAKELEMTYGDDLSLAFSDS